MNQQTLDALYASIKHWEQNVEGPFVDASISSKDCALCKLFARNGCKGCPVAEAVDDISCDSTPYGRAARAYFDVDERYGSTQAFREAAQEELDFLKSLLPQPE